MPFPYNIILRRETALPCPLYHSGATGFHMIRAEAETGVFYKNAAFEPLIKVINPVYDY